MQRLLLGAALFAVSSAAFSQGAFTIRRPVDGSVVRETVEVRIPLSSIPETGFVGIWINGNFKEAIAPIEGVNTNGRDMVYRLNSKALGLVDGNLKIEAVLYADAGGVNRILNRSSVDVRLDNRTSIQVPNGGLRLRYNLTPGREMTYGVEARTSIEMLTASSASRNRSNELVGQVEKFRYRYTVMNSFVGKDGRREGIVKLQPTTPQGQDFVWLTIAGASEPQKYYDYNMAPVYMRIDDVGREIYGTIPFYPGFDGGFGDPSRLDLYALLPLPVLPTRAVTLGGPPLPGFVQTGELDLEKGINTEKFTSINPARGAVEAIEWERGVRCVRINNSIEAGQRNADTQSFEENYWYAIDLGAVIRFDRTFTVTRRMQVPSGGSGGGAGSGGSGEPGAAGGTKRGLSAQSDRPGNEEDYKSLGGSLLQRSPGGGRRGLSSPDDGGDERGSREGGNGRPALSSSGGGGANPGAGGGNRTRLVRQTSSYTLILE